jgi:ribosomal protein L40E
MFRDNFKVFIIITIIKKMTLSYLNDHILTIFLLEPKVFSLCHRYIKPGQSKFLSLFLPQLDEVQSQIVNWASPYIALTSYRDSTEVFRHDGTGYIFYECFNTFDVDLNHKIACNFSEHSNILFFQAISKHCNAFQSNQAKNCTNCRYSV